MKRRVVSLVTALALCLSLCPVWVLAADAEPDTTGLCSHHTSHTAECGYVASSCNHEHVDSCYESVTQCVHEHTDDCYLTAGSGSTSSADSEPNEQEPVSCTHVCSEGSDCIKQNLNCPHTHDDSCYVPGEPCGYVCKVCPIEELIGELPSKVTPENRDQVAVLLNKIRDEYDKLTDGEQKQVDLSVYDDLRTQLDQADRRNETLGEDWVLPGPYDVSIWLRLNMNGFSLGNTNSNTGKKMPAIRVQNTGTLFLLGSGTVRAENGTGIEILPGGFLSIDGQNSNLEITGSIYGLDISSGAEVHLSGGTFFGKKAIRTEDGDFGRLLEPGFAYFNEDGNPIPLGDVATKKLVVVKACGHSDKTYAANSGAATHTWTCTACKMEEAEPCTVAFNGAEVGVCDFCGHEITIEVDQNSLKALAYDETIKPGNGIVTVKVDGSKTLGQDDYKVSYSTRAEAGNTDITVTVTVEGKTYKGTFTKSYTFTKDELGQSVLQWADTSDVHVKYTGEPVESGRLPSVIINVTPNTGLSKYLQYSYSKQRENVYQEGLPTNVGTYDVVATLPEEPVNVEGYQAASSDPITLIVEALDPVKTPPEAKELEYNTKEQKLITPGELHPAAVNDGAVILYATSKTGDYSTTIPVGTNAGGYEVWYKVEATDNCNAFGPKQVVDTKIRPKQVTPDIELSETSYVYDGSKKEPKITVKDDEIVIDEKQYTVTWTDDNDPAATDVLTKAGTYTATITNVPKGNNYTFTETVQVEIVEATQGAVSITGQPSRVCYGDKITTLRAVGGSGNGKVTWDITSGKIHSSIDAETGVLEVKDTGKLTITAERAVPNFGTVTDTWTFDVDPKPVTAVVTITPKDYDGTDVIADGDIKAVVQAADLVAAGDQFTITGLKGAYDDVNAGVSKPVTLDDSYVTASWDTAKYTVSFPKTAVANINRKKITPTFTLSGNDLNEDPVGTYWYTFDGTEKTPTVTVMKDLQELPASEYTYTYKGNKNVGNGAVTVKSTGTGNYTFDDKEIPFTIKSAGAQLKRSPEAKNLTYTGQPQELVTVGEATGGHIEYSVDDITYGPDIPKKIDAGTYTVYYKVVGDSNHQGSAPSGSTSVTIKPKEIITPDVRVSGSYTYNGTPQIPGEADVVVMDGAKTIDNTEYTLSYRDNTDAGTATVIVSNANGGNYIVNGTGVFTIAKDTASVAEAPKGKENLPYNGTPQELVTAGRAATGTMVYSLSENGTYSPTIPVKTDRGSYTVWYKAQGNNNYNDSKSQKVDVDASIVVNSVTTPQIQVRPESVPYTEQKQEPVVTVRDKKGFVIDGSEYEVTYADSNGNNDLIQVGVYTITIQNKAGANYVINDSSATFTIREADQPELVITNTREKVCYGDKIQLDTTGGIGTVEWSDGGSGVADISPSGLLTITGVGSATVKATSSATGYADQIATWSFYADPKRVTAVLTGVDRGYVAGDRSATVKAEVPTSELIPNDSIIIEDLTGTFVDPNVGTDKKVTLDSTVLSVKGVNWTNYVIACPNTTTASITKVDVTDVTPPTLAGTLEYDSTDQVLLALPGSSTEGILEYSLDDRAYYVSLPTGTKAKSYDIWYRVKGDGNHNDKKGEKLGTVIINQQDVPDPIIEFKPNSASYDGSVHEPTVTVKDKNHRVIPVEEYTVIYDSTTNWRDAGDHKVTIKNLENGDYKIHEKVEIFKILEMGQEPLSILNQPGTVRYGDTFTLSAVGGSGTGIVEWKSDDKEIATIDQNGLVKVLKPGAVTITATKLADTNYSAASVTWSFSAERRPVTAIVTANDKVHDGDTKATLVVTWKPGDLVGDDKINTSTLKGSFDTAAVGTNKKVNITGTPVSDTTSEKYKITIPTSTTASITKKAAEVVTLTGKTLTYSGSQQPLIDASAAGGKNVAYSRDGIRYNQEIPTGKDAGSYTVWYKVLGDETQEDSGRMSFVTTIVKATLSIGINPTASNITTNQMLEESELAGGVAKFGETIVSGTFAWTEGSIKLPAGTSEQSVTFTPDDTVNYETFTFKVSVSVTDPDAPTTPGTPEEPDTPDTPGTPEEPDTPDTPGTPEEPDKPDTPGTPEEPDTPDTPGTPEEPDKPDTPGTPEEPDTPDTPGTPEEPDTPDTPGTPEEPDTPDTPGTPEQPGTPETPTTPNPPSTDVGSGSTGSSGTQGSSPNKAPNQVSTSAPVKTNVQNGTATTVVSTSAGSELVKKAAANNSQNVVIKPEIPSSVTKSEVSIPASTVSQLQSKTSAGLTVSTPIADVTIPNAALSALSGASGTVDVVTEQVDNAVALTLTADGKAVENVPGGLTLTVPVEEAGPGTVAVLVHDDGTRETIRKAVPENGTISIPLDGSATVEIADNSKSFTDVPATSWAADAVAFASAHELFNGTSETTFSPDQSMSRGMLATVLYNLEGRPAQSLADEFSDVSSDAWYAAGVSWATASGIANGYGDGQFGPDDNVTREQFAVMLWKCAGSPEANTQDLNFTDVDQISDYTLEALRWATANGILNGYGNGQLDPGGLITRAQVAQMMKNFLENS